ncbi:MAG: histidinol dehydrogenase, partial [Synergistaceae bacterium]
MKVIKKAKPRTNVDNQQLIDNVSAMIKNVRQNGDKALLEYNARFDQNQRPQLRISRTEIEAAYKQVSKQELADMRTAA